jgi:VWFA-related protein
MRRATRRRYVLVQAVAVLLAFVGLTAQGSQDRFRFRTGVELINVAATVTDASGRFVRGLTQADFRVYEDDQSVDVTHFNSERVSVSLGIALDSSASMAGQKMDAARLALEHFVLDLLGPDDEVFLYRFDTRPHLVENWTTDRNRIREDLARFVRTAPLPCTIRSPTVCHCWPQDATGRRRSWSSPTGSIRIVALTSPH